jgi:hypothetical protein
MEFASVSDVFSYTLQKTLRELGETRTLRGKGPVLNTLKNLLIGNTERKAWVVESGALAKLLAYCAEDAVRMDSSVKEALLALLGTLCYGDCPPAEAEISQQQRLPRFIADSLQQSSPNALKVAALRTMRQFTAARLRVGCDRARFAWRSADAEALLRCVQQDQGLVRLEALKTIAVWARHHEGRTQLLQAGAMDVIVADLKRMPDSNLNTENDADVRTVDSDGSEEDADDPGSLSTTMLELISTFIEDAPAAAALLAETFARNSRSAKRFWRGLYDPVPLRRFFSVKILAHLYIAGMLNDASKLAATALPVLLALLASPSQPQPGKSWTQFGIYFDPKVPAQQLRQAEVVELVEKLLASSSHFQRVALDVGAIPVIVNVIEQSCDRLASLPESVRSQESKRSRLELASPTRCGRTSAAASLPSANPGAQSERESTSALRALALIASNGEHTQPILVDDKLMALLLKLLEWVRRAPPELSFGVAEATAQALASLMALIPNRQRQGLHPSLSERLLDMILTSSAPYVVRCAACDALAQCAMPPCPLGTALMNQERALQNLVSLVHDYLHRWDLSHDSGARAANPEALNAADVWRGCSPALGSAVGHGIAESKQSGPNARHQTVARTEQHLVAKIIKIIRILALAASSSEKKSLMDLLTWRSLDMLTDVRQAADVCAQSWALLHNIVYSNGDQSEHEACLFLVLQSPMGLSERLDAALHPDTHVDVRVHALNFLTVVAAADAIPLRAQVLARRELLQRLASFLKSSEVLERFLASWCFTNLLRYMPHRLDTLSVQGFHRKTTAAPLPPAGAAEPPQEPDQTTKQVMRTIRNHLAQLEVLVLLRQVAEHDAAPDVRERARMALWNAQLWRRICDDDSSSSDLDARFTVPLVPAR